MEENGNIIKQRAIHKSNFTIMHNEILFQKDKEGKPISLEALGLFWRIMSLPRNWKLCQNGLASIVGNKSGRIGKLLKELESFGYIKKRQKRKNGQTDGYEYFITETIDPTLWNTENSEIINIENEQLDGSPYPEFPDMEKPYMESPYMENHAQYNMLNNKENKIIKNDNNLSEKFSDSSKSEPLNNNKQNSFQIPVEKKLNMENQESAKGCQKGSQRGQDAKIKKEQRREELKEDLQRRIEEEINKPKVSVDTIVTEKMSDLTDADNLVANAKKLVNVANEKLREAEYKSQKKTSIKKRILAKVDKDIQNQELAVVLKEYLGMWITRGKVMTEEVYNAQLNHLYTITRDPSEQIQIVKTSVQKGWLDLYPLRKDEPFKQNKPNEIYASKIKQEELSSEMYELATDENGNPLTF